MADARAPETEHEVELVSSSGGLSRADRAEIDIQISTAHAYPRSITKFHRNAMDMVTLNVETAQECYYSLKRKDKDGKIVKIEGGSIRLAEIVACTWGNMRAGQRVADIDERMVYGEGFAHDLESNLAVRVEVSRRIVGSSGRRYGDDMIGVTANAACAIAYRNAVLKVVPKAMWVSLLEAARKLVRGDEKSIETRRKTMISEFAKLTVTEAMICEYLEVKGVADIGLDELVELRGVFTAISNGDTTVAEAFAGNQPEQNEQPRRASETKKAEDQPKSAPSEPKKDADGEQLATPEDVAEVQMLASKSSVSLYDLKMHLKNTFGTEKIANLRRSQIPALLEDIKTGKVESK